MEDNNKKSDHSEAQKTDPFKELQDKLAHCEKEMGEYLNGWKRAKADLINYQRDESKRFEEVVKFASIDLIKDFIPVLDSFDLAISVMERDQNSGAAPPNQSNTGPATAFVKGVYMMRTQLEDVLRKRGLERLEVKLGQEFSPNIHESVGEAESGQPVGTVAQVIEYGYTLNGRVVRPARVKLSKATSH